MQRVINLRGEQAISCDGAMNVGSFERDDDVVEIQVFENLYMAERRLDHRFWRSRPVFLQQIFFERAAVDAYANRYFLRLCCAHDLAHALMRTYVTGIKSELINASIERHQSELVMKVYIGDERHIGH